MAGVNTTDLRTAANKVSTVASTVRAHIPTEISGVSSALRNSESGPAAQALAETWTDCFRTWATTAENHASSMLAVADGWERTDWDTGADFDSLGPTGLTTPDNSSFYPGS